MALEVDPILSYMKVLRLVSGCVELNIQLLLPKLNLNAEAIGTRGCCRTQVQNRGFLKYEI